MEQAGIYFHFLREYHNIQYLWYPLGYHRNLFLGQIITRINSRRKCRVILSHTRFLEYRKITPSLPRTQNQFFSRISSQSLHCPEPIQTVLNIILLPKNWRVWREFKTKKFPFIIITIIRVIFVNIYDCVTIVLKIPNFLHLWKRMLSIEIKKSFQNSSLETFPTVLGWP